MNRKLAVAIGQTLAMLTMAVIITTSAEAKEHPRSTRVDQVRRHGDAKMSKRVAHHTVERAIERFSLKVSEAEVVRADAEMYRFLKWKLGAPTAIAAQYISTGYRHFGNGYSDEAAGVLLGIVSFADVEPELVMPPWMQSYLKTTAGNSDKAIAAYLTSVGVPAPLAALIGTKVAAVLSKGVARNVAAFMPKRYDIDNRLIEEAIKAREAAGHRTTGLSSR